MNTTGWLKDLRVPTDGTGIVSHAGVALLRALGDNTGLTAGLSKAMAADRLLIHDRSRALADLVCAIADGAEVISDFRVMGKPGRPVRAGGLGAYRVADAGGDRRAVSGRWAGSAQRSTPPGGGPGRASPPARRHSRHPHRG